MSGDPGQRLARELAKYEPPGASADDGPMPEHLSDEQLAILRSRIADQFGPGAVDVLLEPYSGPLPDAWVEALSSLPSGFPATTAQFVEAHDQLRRLLGDLRQRPTNEPGSGGDPMSSTVQDLTAAYIQAVGKHRLDDLRAMLDPEATFTLGDATFRGVDAFVGAFVRLMPILAGNEIRKIFVDGDEACVIYDFVTSTPAGPVLSVEYLTFNERRIKSSLLVFERLHWPEVMATLVEREANAKG